MTSKAKPFYRTRTFWGTFATSVIHVAVAGATGGKGAAIIAAGQAAGVVLGVVGLRGAVSKNGTGA